MAEGQIWIRFPILLSIIHVLVCDRFPTKHLDKIRVIRHLAIPPACFQLGNPSLFWNPPAKGEKSSTQRPIHLDVGPSLWLLKFQIFLI